MKAIDEEKSVLRWGGLAGILGGIIFILVFVIVIVFVGLDPADPEGEVMRFPDIRAARTVENSLYLVVLILWVTHFLALYRALRGTSLARGARSYRPSATCPVSVRRRSVMPECFRSPETSTEASSM